MSPAVREDDRAQPLQPDDTTHGAEGATDDVKVVALADLAAAKKASGGKKPKSDARTKLPTQSAMLVDMAMQRFIFGCTPAHVVYAVPVEGPNIAYMLRSSHTSVRMALADAYYQQTGQPASASALADALLVLQTKALGKDAREVGYRVARYDKGIVLDLGTADGRAVVVGPTGWTTRRSSPVLFRRTQLTAALPEPVRGGSVDELWPLLNVLPEDQPLVLAWLVASFIPDLPHPILLLRGQQGTAKTSTGSALISLVDPSAANLRSLPTSGDGYAVQANGSWIVGFDNISTIPDWMADAMCRTVTGDGWCKRELYADDGLVVLSYRRVLVLTGIDIGSLRGDLAERLLPVELEPIEPGKRMLDAEVAARLATARPRLLGALLDLLSRVLAILPTVHRDDWPRMADFARVMAAMDEVLGTEGYKQYTNQGGDIAAEVVSGDPVAEALVRTLALRGGQAWMGTASELLEQIAPLDRPPKGWPESGRALSGRLRRMAPSLEQVGVLVTFDRSGHARERRITVAAATGHADANADANAQSADAKGPDADAKRAEGPVQ